MKLKAALAAVLLLSIASSNLPVALGQSASTPEKASMEFLIKGEPFDGEWSTKTAFGTFTGVYKFVVAKQDGTLRAFIENPQYVMAPPLDYRDAKAGEVSNLRVGGATVTFTAPNGSRYELKLRGGTLKGTSIHQLSGVVTDHILKSTK